MNFLSHKIIIYIFFYNVFLFFWKFFFFYILIPSFLTILTLKIYLRLHDSLIITNNYKLKNILFYHFPDL